MTSDGTIDRRLSPEDLAPRVGFRTVGFQIGAGRRASYPELRTDGGGENSQNSTVAILDRFGFDSANYAHAAML
jgi:hypothetical protein